MQLCCASCKGTERRPCLASMVAYSPPPPTGLGPRLFQTPQAQPQLPGKGREGREQRRRWGEEKWWGEEVLGLVGSSQFSWVLGKTPWV